MCIYIYTQHKYINMYIYIYVRQNCSITGCSLGCLIKVATSSVCWPEGLFGSRTTPVRGGQPKGNLTCLGPEAWRINYDVLEL